METNGIFEPYQQLEQAWAKFIGAEHAVACSSGTAGLHLSLAVLGIGPGDEVIVPEFTMVATAWAVTYLGATPVFVDCGDDLNIDQEKMRAAITSRTKAIIVTHVYGRPVQWLPSFLPGSGIPIIEDACEAHGAEIDGQRVGTFGDLAVFSLHKNKIIQSEEGGLITTGSPRHKAALDNLKSMGFTKEHNFIHAYLAYNYRLTNMQAQMALRELAVIGYYLEDRDEFKKYLDLELEELTLYRPKGSVVWVYDMLFPSQYDRDLIYGKLLEASLPVRLFFAPMSMQPMYYSGTFRDLKAFDFSQRGLYIPFTKDTAVLDKTIKIIKENL